MGRSNLVFHTRSTWLRQPGRLAIAAALCVLAGAGGWVLTSEPAPRQAIVVPDRPGWGGTASPFGLAAPPTLSTPAAPPVAVPEPPRPAAAPSTPPPVSTMVAPGVHITPMSVPAGAVPRPAGPQPHDSEPEN